MPQTKFSETVEEVGTILIDSFDEIFEDDDLNDWDGDFQDDWDALGVTFEHVEDDFEQRQLANSLRAAETFEGREHKSRRSGY